ncbi:MAG TPA: 3-hydroxyacyl-CoA dehydrogenase NAD-binding domain-containing protein [Gaiellaceae bacterium]|nr:3-hydroxyacyl-CoA dehydrogenase NAD-binding domain-containing protein [Gaiellaceae bacterium]
MRPSAAGNGRRVAVLGAGTMAPGIAAAFAVAGDSVVLWARRPEAAEAALARARTAAAFLVEHELAPAPPPPDALAASSRLGDVADADVVVEAIAEQLEAKHELLAELETVVAPDTLVATNTSGLRVTDIAAPLARPERVVAMHFWNPAHLMPLVEVGGGARTSPESVDAAYELARAIGKQPVRVEQEVLGFLGTRLQQAVVREAIALVERGVASPEDVDLAVRTSFGIRFPVTGPLESADISGLDVIEAIHEYLLPDLDRSTEPQAPLRERVAAGALGVKSGRGFHDWQARDSAELIRRRDEELVRRLRLDR